MRVAVVSASYAPGRSYQENVWAETLALAGHAVCVFTVGARSAAAQTVREGGATYAVAPVTTWAFPRHIYFTRRLGDAILGFAPDLVLWFGVPMYFGRDLVRDRRLRGLPVVAFFSLNSGMHPFDWRRAGTARGALHALAFHALRAADVVAGCRRADLIVGVTPETRDILRLYPRAADWPAIDAKIRTVPLGYDARTFAYDPELRRAARTALGYSEDDVVVVTSSRFASEKVPALTACLAAIDDAMRARPRLRALVVGADEGPISQRFAAQIAAGPHAERVRLRPFADRAELARLYHAADLALFTRPTISCQETMGTGCYAVFSQARAIGHLVSAPIRGLTFDPHREGAMAAALVQACDRFAAGEIDRAAVAEANRDLSYDALSERVLAEVRAATSCNLV